MNSYLAGLEALKFGVTFNLCRFFVHGGGGGGGGIRRLPERV